MDVNRQQCDGAMNSVMEVGDIAAKMEQFGAKVVWADAHNLDQMRATARTSHRG